MYAVRYTSDEVTGTKYRNWFEDCSGKAEVNAKYLALCDVNGVPSVKAGTYPQPPEKDDYVTSVIKNNKKFASYSDLTYWANDLNDLKSVVGEEKFKQFTADVPQGVIYRDDEGKIDIYTIQQMFTDIKSGRNEDE